MLLKTTLSVLSVLQSLQKGSLYLLRPLGYHKEYIRVLFLYHAVIQKLHLFRAIALKIIFLCLRAFFRGKTYLFGLFR